MSNPFLQDGESTHEYKNQMFVVDFYPHPLGNTWQCSDSNHYIRARANTKQEAIDQAHKEWDEYKPTETMTNNKQQTAVDSIIEFCQKQMDNDSSIHKGVYLSIIKFCKEQITEESEIHWKTTLLMKAEKIKFATDFFFWWYNQTSGTNTYEAVEKFYEQTYGGGEQ